MASGYVIQDKPFVVPTTDGKLIEEVFGLAGCCEACLRKRRDLGTTEGGIRHYAHCSVEFGLVPVA